MAGQFYPGSKTELLHEVEEFLRRGEKASGGKRVRALGVIAPHAGYMYSGGVAGAVYAHVEVPRRVIVLCPNHTGMGAPLAITSAGSFRTPLGDAPVDEALAAVAQPVRLRFLWRPMLKDPADEMVLDTAVNGQAAGSPPATRLQPARSSRRDRVRPKP